MGRIFVTGDTHGDIDITKVNTTKFPIQKELTRDDLLIVCGDFGGIWDGDGQDRYILNWWSQKPFTVVFCDGNHENFALLNDYPVEMWNGGKVHRIRDNIIHLMRGQIYTINDRTFYVMGGAVSIDKGYRKAYISWWLEEVPSAAEMQEGFQNLEKHGNKVDYIITHDGPATVVAQMYAGLHRSFIPDEVERGFDMMAESVDFQYWFFGHHHEDKRMGKFICCYQDIYEIHPDTAVNRY